MYEVKLENITVEKDVNVRLCPKGFRALEGFEAIVTSQKIHLGSTFFTFFSSLSKRRMFCWAVFRILRFVRFHSTLQTVKARIPSIMERELDYAVKSPIQNTIQYRDTSA